MPFLLIFILSKFMYSIKDINNTELYAVENKSHSLPNGTSINPLENIILNC